MDRWETWLSELQFMNCKIPRCFKPKHRFGHLTCEIHHFCDASENHGYGMVFYLRFVDEAGEIFCSFLYGKSRVRPLRRGITVPRLELTAAVVAVTVNSMILSEL